MIAMRLISFFVGLYSGIYVCQNYEVPQLPGPLGLWEQIKEKAKEFEKKDR